MSNLPNITDKIHKNVDTVLDERIFSNLRWLNKDKKLLKFQIDNIDVSIINSIRRTILSDIENVSFDFSATGTENTIFYKNTSPLHNEFLGHRLCLIPICLTPDEIIDFDTDNYTFILKVKNTTNEVIDITSKDIIIKDKDDNIMKESFRDRVFPKNIITGDFILINKLKPNMFDITKGDEIDIKMKAIKNTAKYHTSFCPVSICSFYNIIDEIKANKVLNERIKNNATFDKEIFNNLEKQKYYYTNDYNEPNKFEFLIQSECLLKPEYIFLKGIFVLNDKLENFKTKIINNEFEEDTSQSDIDNEIFIYELTIKDETHTIGNLIQSMFYNKFIKNNSSVLNKEAGAIQQNLTYIGYNMPHPLDNSLIIKLQFNKLMDHLNSPSDSDKKSNSAIKNFIIDGIDNIQFDLNNLIKIWFNISKLFENKDYAKDLQRVI
jgi:DNA-directed RNA polymerase subunit L